MTRHASACIAGMVMAFATVAFAADTLESVEKTIAEKMVARKSLQFKMRTTSDMATSQTRIKMDMEMVVRCERRPENKYVSRIEAKSTTIQKMADEPEKKTKSDTLTVVDGKHVYILTRSEDVTSAMKHKLDSKMAMNLFDVAEQFKMVREDRKLKLLPDETVDGKSCYAIEAVAKDPAEKMLRSLTYYYDKKSGIGIKTMGYDKANKVTVTTVVTDLKIDEDIPDDQFEFKPPPGVQVVDMSQNASAAGESDSTTQPASDGKTSEPQSGKESKKEDKPAQSGEQKKEPAGKGIKGLLKDLGR